jgi:hypothetical protein
MALIVLNTTLREALKQEAITLQSKAVDDWLRGLADALCKPVDMILHCPKCHTQHIDGPEETDPATWTPERYGNWTNPPHRSHLCHHCGCIWRPADVPTNGVASIHTAGKADTWLSQLAVLDDVKRVDCYDDPPGSEPVRRG